MVLAKEPLNPRFDQPTSMSLVPVFVEEDDTAVLSAGNKVFILYLKPAITPKIKILTVRKLNIALDHTSFCPVFALVVIDSIEGRLTADVFLPFLSSLTHEGVFLVVNLLETTLET